MHSRPSRRRARLRFEDRLGLLGGGIVGTLLRVGVQDLVPTTADDVPWSTLIVNVAGSFVLGALLTLWRRSDLPGRALKSLHTAVATGIIGGFTTFSDFAVEVTHDAAADPQAASVYAIGSIAAAVAAAVLGAVLAGRLKAGRVST